MIPGVDPCDNSEIGSLKHDAWTYWGHSGAPLTNADDASLIGLHSSWDERTMMRHGVSLHAARRFLSETLNSVDTIDADEKKSLALLCVPKDPNLHRPSTTSDGS